MQARRSTAALLIALVGLAAPVAAQDRPETRIARDIVRNVELAVIQQRLREHPTKASAARSLGLTREALYDKLKRLQTPVER